MKRCIPELVHELTSEPKYGGHRRFADSAASLNSRHRCRQPETLSLSHRNNGVATGLPAPACLRRYAGWRKHRSAGLAKPGRLPPAGRAAAGSPYSH